MNANLTITATPCNLGEGCKVQVKIAEMGIWQGTKATIERRFDGGRESTRYHASRYIRAIRKLWRDGVLLDIVANGSKGAA